MRINNLLCELMIFYFHFPLIAVLIQCAAWLLADVWCILTWPWQWCCFSFASKLMERMGAAQPHFSVVGCRSGLCWVLHSHRSNGVVVALQG